MKKRILGFLTVFLAVVALLTGCEKKYTVDFEENDGSEVAAVTVVGGQLLEEPTAPTKEDMTFLGWYADIDLTEKYDFSQPVTESLILYAHWGVTLTFDSLGGSSVDPIVGKALSPMVLPDAPTREGYVFAGWYQDKAYTKPQTLLSPAKNATAYAKWEVFDNDTKLDLNNWTMNDANSYNEEVHADGSVTYTATANKGEWSYVKSVIDYNVKSYSTVVIKLVGTKGAKIKFKFEQGGVAAVETGIDGQPADLVFTGEEQTFIWTVQESNLTETGGEWFMFFLNPGVAGATEGAPEYVTFKSCALYKTVAEGEENKESVIFFNTNGGSAVAPIYALKGSEIAAPVAPTKAGYVFKGWYADSEFIGLPYEFTTMPNEQVELHAKWELGVDAIEDKYAGLDADTYTFAYANGVLKVKKIGTGEWQFAAGSLTGKDILNTNTLTVTLKGVAGQKISFKINDQYEYHHECNGEVQTINIDYSHLKINKGAKALLMFINGGVAGASEEFEIYQLQFRSSKSILADTYAGLDANTYTFSYENGLLKVKKTGTGEWQFAAGTLTGADILGYTKLNVTIKGVAGQVITLKVNDKKEIRIECNGQLTSYTFDISDVAINKNGKALIMFINGGVAGASEEFEISQIEFTDFVATDVPLKSVNMLEDTFTTGETAAFNISQENGVLTFAKTAAGGKWSNIASTLGAPAIEGMTLLKVTVTGEAGNKVLFKINDSIEKWVEFTAESLTQTHVFEIDFTVNPNAKALLIFPNGDIAGASGTFTVTKLEFATYKDGVNMLEDTFTTGETDAFNISQENGVLTFAKTAAGGKWSNIASTLAAPAIAGMTLLKVTVTGEAGNKVLFKINDSIEKWVEFTAESLTQTLVFEIEFEANPNAKALLIFPNGDIAGASGTFTVTKLEFAMVKDPLSIVHENFNSGEATAFEATHDNGNLVIAKTADGGEWSCICSESMGPAIKGYTKLTVTVTGEAGQKLLIKVNDKLEQWVEFTAESLTQTVVVNLAELEVTDDKCALYLFPNAMTAGASGTFVLSQIVFGN